MTPEDQLSAISSNVREMVRQHRHCLMQELLPALADRGPDPPPADSGSHRRPSGTTSTRYFQANVFPVLTPLAVDPGHPFPYISNLSLSLAVALRGADGEERFARVKVPKILPRWVPLPTPNAFVPLEEVIGANLEALFPGVEILGWYTFRITRNTDLQIDHGDEADDLLSLIQEEVRNRRFAEVVRIEVHASMPPSLRELLLMEFSEQQDPPTRPLTTDDLYEIQGLMDTADLLDAGLARSAGAARSRVPSGHPAAPGVAAQHLRRDPRGRRPAPPPVRQLPDLGRAVHPDGRGGPGRPRHQAHALPHRRRLQHRPDAGRRRPSAASRWRS